ncbi:hypothetical protein GCM10027419_14000 [Pandoraea terrae]
MVVFAAFLVRSLLHPILDRAMPGVMFVCAAIIVEFLWGLGPAILAMFISIPIFDFFFVPPFRDVTTLDRRDVLIVIGFLLIAPLAVALIEWLRRAQYRAELLAEVSQTRYEMLLRADNERLVLADSVKLGNALMTYLTRHLDAVFYIANPALRYEYLDERFRRYSGAAPEELQRSGLRGQLHPDDAARMAGLFDASLPMPARGAYTLRVRNARGGYDLLTCELEFFHAALGTFTILRRRSLPPATTSAPASVTADASPKRAARATN